jgi:spore germination cell wall hydrolase CwlJ-like protein
MPVPDWAREAVDAAVAAGIVDTPEGGSYDFYRMLTVLFRKGLI